MKRRVLFCCITLILIISARSASATSTYVWTGLGGNTNWNNNNNWLPNTGFPGSTDAAQIGVATYTGVNPVINTTGLSCGSLTIGSNTAVTLTINNAFTVTGSITINGNSTITGASTITGSSLTVNNVTLTLNAPLNITTSGITVNSGTINGSAAALVTVSLGGITLTSSNATFNGKIAITGNVQVPGSGTVSTFTTNATGNTLSGIYDHTGSNLTWNGSGTTTCAQGDVSSGQTLTIGSGNNVTFTGNFELHGSSPNVGMLVNNGIISTNSSFFSDNLGSGSVTAITNNNQITLTGTATLTVGSFTNISNSGKIIANTGTIIGTGGNSTITNNSAGLISLTGAQLNLVTNTTLNNSGTVTAITSSSINLSGNPATLNNSGNLNITSSTLSATGASPVISNSGTITASALTGTLSGNGLSFTNINTITATSNSQFNFSGNPQSIINSATISLDASAITISGNTTPTINSGNIILTNASTFSITGGSSSPIINSGNFLATSSALKFTAGSGNTITNSGNFSATSTPITFGTGTWTVNNSGNFSALTGSDISMPGNSSVIKSTAGTVTVTSSNINLSGQPTSIQNSGSSTFKASGSIISLAQSAFLQQTSSNSFTVNGGSTINFATLSYITNQGTFFAGTTNSSKCILNLTTQGSYINNSTANGKFFLGSTSIIYPSGVQAAVTNTSPAIFTLQSDKYGSASIGPLYGNLGSPSQNAVFTGTFNVERYYQGNAGVFDAVKNRWEGRSYRIISSPVSNTTQVNSNNVFGLNYIVGATAGLTTTANSLTNAFVTGATGGSTVNGNPTLYLYRESITPSNATFTSGNFIGITNITNSSTTGLISTSDGGTSNSIPAGSGVLFFFRGPATNFATRTVSPFISPADVIFTQTGNINQQPIAVKDWYSPTSTTLAYTGTGTGTNSSVRGFNMVGNPYPCSIDWNTVNTAGIVATNIDPTIYVFDPVTDQYDTYSYSSHLGNSANFTGIIASGQGFYVRATSAGPASLTFTENAKAPTSLPASNTLLMGVPAGQVAVNQLLRLRLALDTLNYDDIVFAFSPTASPKYNSNEDATYLSGMGAPEGLASLSADSIKLSINFLPLPKVAPQVIKLYVTARASGIYTFKRTELDAIPQIYEIWLMDKYKKDSLDLRSNTDYAFNLNIADTASYGSNRFEIVIRQSTALGVHLLAFTATKSSDGSQLIWKTENEQNYTNFTVEKSTDNGVTFNVLSGLLSDAQGTYSYIDKNPGTTLDLYRIKLEDLNGTITYSKIIALDYSNGKNAAANNNISIYPNPAIGVINLAIKTANVSTFGNPIAGLQSINHSPSLAPAQNTAALYAIKIINISGTVVKSATSAQPAWQDNISELLPGTYIIQVLNNGDKSLVGKGTFVKM